MPTVTQLSSPYMGKKTRRIQLEDIIVKNGKQYVKQKHQNHRVCECRVVYRNCVKCNIKLAKRHSDYITLIVKHAKESSLHRKITRPHEDHSFCSLYYSKLLLLKIVSSKLLCECEMCSLIDRKRQPLSVRGPNKISVDRVHDHLGYTHVDQELKLVSKSHHSWQKHDTSKIPASGTKKWIHSVKDGIVQRSQTRFDKMNREILDMDGAGMDTTEMVRNLGTHLVDTDNCYSMLIEKMTNNKECAKCRSTLEYGDDDNGYILTKCNPRRASPDRIDNRKGYTRENVQIVCHACQTMASLDDHNDIYLNEKEVSDLIAYIESRLV